MVRLRHQTRNKILFEARSVFKMFLGVVFLPSIIVMFLVYFAISFIDPNNTLSYNSFPTAFILGVGSIISFKVLFYTRLERHEIKKLVAASLFIIITFFAEILYVYQQFVLEISVPYPSFADILYLSANLFLAYHIISSLIALKKQKSIKSRYILLINLVISIIPIYITLSVMISSEMNIADNDAIIPFFTDLLYYIFDLVMLAPSIFILLHINKNSLLIFHWLSITLGIAFLTIGDLGYTYSAQISEQLIVSTHTIWNIFYATAYILLIAGIFWYGKIKQILFNKETNTVLKSMQIFEELKKYYVNEDDSNVGPAPYEFNENIKGSLNISKNAIKLLQKAETEIDILVAKESFLTINNITEVFDFINKFVHQKNNINIRILVPLSLLSSSSPHSLSETKQYDWVSLIKNNQVKIQYFERNINLDAIVFLIDNKYLFSIDIKPEDINKPDLYNARYTNNQSVQLVYSNIFERMWLSEISNRIS